jgi:Protein of unknown function (DUF1326)
MKHILISATLVLCLMIPSTADQKQGTTKGSAWNMNATIIEACSCPMFCQCYFNAQPAAPGGHEGHGSNEHFCRFNNAFKVNKGSYGTVKLDGAKFWVAGDLGGDFSKGQMDWAVVTFDKSLAKEQRDAIANILSHLYPVKWNKLTASEGEIAWTPGMNEARASIDGGKTAEVVLRHPGKDHSNVPSQPVVIKNLKYWGAPRHDGFILMPNVVEAYRAGDKPFEFKGTNGFMITLDIDSKTAPPAAGGGS